MKQEPNLATMIGTLALGALALPFVAALQAKAWIRAAREQRTDPVETKLWQMIFRRRGGRT